MKRALILRRSDRSSIDWLKRKSDNTGRVDIRNRTNIARLVPNRNIHWSHHGIWRHFGAIHYDHPATVFNFSHSPEFYFMIAIAENERTLHPVHFRCSNRSSSDWLKRKLDNTGRAATRNCTNIARLVPNRHINWSHHGIWAILGQFLVAALPVFSTFLILLNFILWLR